MATNFNVAYGTVSETRLVKSLEPTIVTLLQYLAGMLMDEGTHGSPCLRGRSHFYV